MCKSYVFKISIFYPNMSAICICLIAILCRFSFILFCKSSELKSCTYSRKFYILSYTFVFLQVVVPNYHYIKYFQKIFHFQIRFATSNTIYIIMRIGKL